jgi:ABC-type Mn2+/Zn2+ transport system permease subunit
VIELFFASWELFHNTYVAGWAIAFSLSALGVLVVARDQVFIGAAVSQASTFGVALAIWLGGIPALAGLGSAEGHGFRSVFAVVFSLLATVLTSRGGREGRESHEAITGWVFLVSASGATLLLAHSPHGLEEIQRLLASSLIGATTADVAAFVAVAGGTALALARLHRPLLLVSVDPAMAAAVGLRPALWSAAIAAWLGAVVGLAIHVAGMLYTFGCLVLPALAARSVAREIRSMLVLSPLIALGASGLGFVVANAHDYPPAQMTVGFLCAALVLGWAHRLLRRWGSARPETRSGPV